jgi:hypothetical protein
MLIFTAIIFIIDFYSYKGIKKIKIKLEKGAKKFLKFTFWSIPVVIILALISMFLFRTSVDPEFGMIYFNYLSGTFLLFYIPKVIFILFNIIDDLYHFLKYIVHKLKHIKSEKSDVEKITRSTFLTRAGIIIAGIPFLSIIYGIGWGRFDFIVRKSNLTSSILPDKFDGFKIAQISDFHLGSFLSNKDKVEDVVSLINKQKPDLILFTGDLVNNLASEIEPFIKTLSKLKAKYGMYSILGNHDYGEYVPWETPEKKKENVDKIMQFQNMAGFKMMLNESTKISIDDSFITLIGIENWGLPPFPQYGDLRKALTDVDNNSFKILMSHDPTHWDAQVVEQTDIDLTLSGHTHGAQFGVEIPGWRWSPVNLRYKQWGGIYKNGKQVLNVNTGIGFIGFPGRIGMPPEVGLITLRKG